MDNHVREVMPEQVLKRLENGDKIQIIDVRELHEWNAGHIPEAKHIALGTLPHRLNELDKETPIVMVCRSGVRSWNATQFVEQHGFQAENLAGGMLAWPGKVAKE